MKLTRVLADEEVRVAMVDGDELVVLDRDLTTGDLEAGALTPAPSAQGRRPVAGAELLPPVPSPGKIIAVGLNYFDHADEAAENVPERPLLFAKTNNTLLPHDGVILVDPEVTAQVDFEGELAVVIGRPAARVSRERALEHVFGYTIANDVSARDVQFEDGQWMRGKSLDTFCPLGPYVVTADDIDDPQALRIVTTVNGAVMQEESTNAMIFAVAEIISFISQSITLQPGDIVLTGTPAGVGFARTPPVFLADGDMVTVTIEPIGTLRNSVRTFERGVASGGEVLAAGSA